MRLCNIHFGIGSDGIVMKVPSTKADFGFRVYNPDGSEAEKKAAMVFAFYASIFMIMAIQRSRQFSVETLTDIVCADIV